MTKQPGIRRILFSVVAASAGSVIFALVMLWRLTSEGHEDVAHRAMAMPAAFIGLVLVGGAMVNLGLLVGSLERRVAALEVERDLLDRAPAARRDNPPSP
jgi:hypothetical protein